MTDTMTTTETTATTTGGFWDDYKNYFKNLLLEAAQERHERTSKSWNKCVAKEAWKLYEEMRDLSFERQDDDTYKVMDTEVGEVIGFLPAAEMEERFCPQVGDVLEDSYTCSCDEFAGDFEWIAQDLYK